MNIMQKDSLTAGSSFAGEGSLSDDGIVENSKQKMGQIRAD